MENASENVPFTLHRTVSGREEGFGDVNMLWGILSFFLNDPEGDASKESMAALSSM